MDHGSYGNKTSLLQEQKEIEDAIPQNNAHNFVFQEQSRLSSPL